MRDDSRKFRHLRAQRPRRLRRVIGTADDGEAPVEIVEPGERLDEMIETLARNERADGEERDGMSRATRARGLIDAGKRDGDLLCRKLKSRSSSLRVCGLVTTTCAAAARACFSLSRKSAARAALNPVSRQSG